MSRRAFLDLALILPGLAPAHLATRQISEHSVQKARRGAPVLVGRGQKAIRVVWVLRVLLVILVVRVRVAQAAAGLAAVAKVGLAVVAVKATEGAGATSPAAAASVAAIRSLVPGKARSDSPSAAVCPPRITTPLHPRASVRHGPDACARSNSPTRIHRCSRRTQAAHSSSSGIKVLSSLDTLPWRTHHFAAPEIWARWWRRE